VTYRTSTDGLSWSDDAACPNQEWSPEYTGQPFDPQFHFCDKGWNEDGMILPTGGASTVNEANSADPPEMEFYKLMPMRVGATKRWVGHALTYAPSPQRSLGAAYGMRPSACPANKSSPTNAKDLRACHGEPSGGLIGAPCSPFTRGVNTAGRC
jgi:hypothetical protein